MTHKSKQAQLTAGFTLLEIVVVIMIMGIVLSFTVLSLDNRSAKHTQEARRLAAIIRLAAEEAILSSREYKLQISRDKYSFKVLAGRKWQKLDDELLRDRQLPEGFYFQVTIENEKIDWPEDGSKIDGVGIYLLSSGECTPFAIIVRDRYNDAARQEVSNIKDGITRLQTDGGT